MHVTTESHGWDIMPVVYDNRAGRINNKAPNANLIAATEKVDDLCRRESAYLQLSDLVVGPLEFKLGEVLVQTVHLPRLGHRVDRQGVLELLVVLFVWIRGLVQLVMVVLQTL